MADPKDADATKGNGHDPSLPITEGITWQELYQKFLAINGGRTGFYLYRSRDDEAKYFASAALVREAIATS